MTEQSKYSDVFKALRNDVKLVDLGGNVRSIRHNRTGALILAFKRYKKRKDAADKILAVEVLYEGVEVGVLVAEATLKVKNLD